MAKLGEVFKLQMGKTPSRNNSAYWQNGKYKWVSIADLGNYKKYTESTKERITELAVSDTGIKSVPANTVIMSFKLSLGKTAITKENIFTNEAIMAFIPNGNFSIIPDYFYYLFSGMDWTKETRRAVMGATLNKDTLSKITVSVPPLEEQQKIAAVLDKVTDLIDKRKQQLDKLDELIKSRFVEMFGDPVTNEKKWEIFPLGKLCSVSSSKRIYQSELSPYGIPFLRISDLTNLISTKIIKSTSYISEEKYNELKHQKQVPITGDILITSRGTLGQCYIIKEKDKFYFQDGMVSWLSEYTTTINPLYISWLFSMAEFQKQITQIQAGSTVAYLSIDKIKKIKIMLPDLNLQNQFAEFVEQTEKIKVAINHSLDKLETLKKALMQKYFN